MTKVRITRPAATVDAKNVILGQEYTDTVTGIKGTATAVYIYITGCDQVCLTYVQSGEAKHHIVDATRLGELAQVERPSRGGPDGIMPPSKASGSRLS